MNKSVNGGSVQSKFENRVLKKRPYIVFSNKDFKDLDSNSFSLVAKRAEDKGLIVKIGKGLFYRRSFSENRQINNLDEMQREKYIKPKRFNNPSFKYELRHKKVVPAKFPKVSYLFWSNKNNPIDIDKYISKVIEGNFISVYPFLQLGFGDRKVIEVYLKNFKSKGIELEFFEEFFCV